MTTDDVPSLDIRQLNQRGLLRGNWSGSGYWYRGEEQSGSIGLTIERYRISLRYRYRNADDWQSVQQDIALDTTPCHYGGERYWFLCPHCTRRVAVLYSGAKYFLCRFCYQIPYTSQYENHFNRMYRRARKYRRQLGADLDLFQPINEKPKGMHWKTYRRLVDNEENAMSASTASVMEAILILGGAIQ
jgi:hypothetical protein